jgi:hypothetical protein
MDFGVWPEEFKEDLFDQFVEKELNSSQTTEGIFAPWMMYKEDFNLLGGHDPILKSAREDSDIFNRMLLAGYKFVQSWSSLVYHFTGRGGQFQHGSVGEQKDKEWQQLMNNSTKEFIRKWGSNVKHTPLMKPIISPKYNIGFVIKHCNLQLLDALEPWCDRVYVDKRFEIGRAWDYVEKESEHTHYDLSKRVAFIGNQTPTDYEDIVVEIDGRNFSNYDFQIIQQLPEIIKDSGEIGRFQLGNLNVEISSMKEYQNFLIKL